MILSVCGGVGGCCACVYCFFFFYIVFYFLHLLRRNVFHRSALSVGLSLSPKRMGRDPKPILTLNQGHQSMVIRTLKLRKILTLTLTRHHRERVRKRDMARKAYCLARRPLDSTGIPAADRGQRR